jgi:hypothetical protein
MDYSLLSCDLICDSEGMPYRCVGVFEMHTSGKGHRVEIELHLKEEMTIKFIKEQLFMHFEDFKHNFETIQSAKAQMLNK